MRRVVTPVLVIVLICAAAIGGYRWYEYKGSPEYSLACLAKAIKVKDYETARYYVDEERVSRETSKALVEVVVTRTTKDMEKDQNPFSGFGVAVVQMMVPRMQEMMKEKVQDGVKDMLSGGDQLTGSAQTPSGDPQAFANVRVAQTVIAGNTAEVLLDGFPTNPMNITEFRLRMARIPDTRSWRVVEAPDMPKLMTNLLDQAEAESRSGKNQ